MENDPENRILTPEEFSAAMMQIKDGTYYASGKMYDAENQHVDADYLMCDVLRSLGYGEGIDIFCSMTRWYA